MDESKQEFSISETLKALRYGTLDEELGEKLHELVRRVDNTQRVGSIALTLKIKPGGPGRIEITDEIKVTMPKEQKGSSIMFVMPSGNLARTDPRQMEIEGLKTIDKETGEIKSVPAPSPVPLRRAQ
ncbi:MAG TPA: hypothetical protein VNQ97_11875 [Burkholderiaceae bacterium]|nr:hypothetical protein [Burkholderiaceae bacterium]